MKETLEVLKQDYRLFIVSNAQCGYPELMMEKLGIRQHFEGWMCFGDTGLPKGDTIRILMERHGVTDAVYIGDTQGDLEASQKAGIPFQKVFANDDPDKARAFGIKQAPTLVVVKDGQIEKFAGVAEIKKFIG